MRDAVTHLAVLDCIPIVEHLERTDARFAAAWWHWFFFAQPDKPEQADYISVPVTGPFKPDHYRY